MDRVNRNRNAFPAVKHLHKCIRQWVWIGIVGRTVHDFWCFFFCLWGLLLFPFNLAKLSWGLCCDLSHPHCSLDGVFYLHTQIRLILFFFLALLILSIPSTCISRRAGDVDQGIILIQLFLDERQFFLLFAPLKI